MNFFCFEKENVSFSQDIQISCFGQIYILKNLQGHHRHYCIFLYLGFFREHLRFTEQEGKGEAISLILLYHFHLLQRRQEISRAITVHSSNFAHRAQPDLNRDSERESLTSKLRALKVHFRLFL